MPLSVPLRLALAVLCLPGATARADTVPMAIPVAPSATPAWSETYARAVPGIVRLDNGEALGTGFVFHAPNLIATAFHVVSARGETRVTTVSGEVRTARTVAWDEALDVALLELDRPLEVVPLRAAGDDVAIGTPIGIIGNPEGFSALDPRLEGLLLWSLTTGVVSAAGPRLLQTDALITHGNSGGPALTAEGRVVGVVSSMLKSGQAFLARTSLLEPLVERLQGGEAYPGGWAIEDTAAIVGVQASSAGGLLGVGVGTRLVVHDLWCFGLRATSYSLPDLAGNLLGAFEGSPVRRQVELGLSYRVLLRPPEGPPLHFDVGLAAMYRWAGTYTAQSTHTFAQDLLPVLTLDGSFPNPQWGVRMRWSVAWLRTPWTGSSTARRSSSLSSRCFSRCCRRSVTVSIER